MHCSFFSAGGSHLKPLLLIDPGQETSCRHQSYLFSSFLLCCSCWRKQSCSTRSCLRSYSHCGTGPCSVQAKAAAHTSPGCQRHFRICSTDQALTCCLCCSWLQAATPCSAVLWRCDSLTCPAAARDVHQCQCKRDNMQSKAELSKRATTRCNAKVLEFCRIRFSPAHARNYIQHTPQHHCFS